MDDPGNQDAVTFKSRLYFNDVLLPYSVRAGKLFRQFSVGDLFIIVLILEGWEDFSFRILVLSSDLDLLEQHISPNFFAKGAHSYDRQFLTFHGKLLEFSLDATNTWVLEPLEKPRHLAVEALFRIKNSWWVSLELPRLFRKSYVSIRPLNPLST